MAHLSKHLRVRLTASTRHPKGEDRSSCLGGRIVWFAGPSRLTVHITVAKDLRVWCVPQAVEAPRFAVSRLVWSPTDLADP